MTEQTQSPFELEDDGIPDHSGPLESKALTGDAQDGIGAPSRRPASLDFGTTAEEQRDGESLDGRLAREVPDVDLAAHEPYPGSPGKEPSYGGSPAGRIVEDDQVATDVGSDHGGFTAEEAAMHIEPEV